MLMLCNLIKEHCMVLTFEALRMLSPFQRQLELDYDLQKERS